MATKLRAMKRELVIDGLFCTVIIDDFGVFVSGKRMRTGRYTTWSELMSITGEHIHGDARPKATKATDG